MSQWHDPFLLGPLGALLPIPSPPHSEGVAAPDARIGASHVSLYGGRTRDTFAVKRTWQFTWPWVTPEQRALLRARSRNLHGVILRMVDPFETNRLAGDTAAGGSESRTADRFEATAGTALFAPFDVAPPGLEGVLAGGIAWNLPANLGGDLRADTAEPVRLPLTAETVTLSAYVRGSGTVSAVLTPYDEVGLTGTPAEGAPVVLTGDWQRLTVTHTPAAGEVSAAVALSAASDAVVRDIDTTAWQAETGTAPTEWRSGAGCPEVHADLTGDVYKPHRRHEAQLTVMEV